MSIRHVSREREQLASTCIRISLGEESAPHTPDIHQTSAGVSNYLVIFCLHTRRCHGGGRHSRRGTSSQGGIAMKLLKNPFATAVLGVAVTALALLGASPANANGYQQRHDRMSSMGKRAQAAVARINAQSAHVKAATAVHALAKDNQDNCINGPECGGEEEGDAEAIPGGQAEVSIAVDESGQHVVIGYN